METCSQDILAQNISAPTASASSTLLGLVVHSDDIQKVILQNVLAKWLKRWPPLNDTRSQTVHHFRSKKSIKENDIVKISEPG